MYGITASFFSSIPSLNSPNFKVNAYFESKNGEIVCLGRLCTLMFFFLNVGLLLILLLPKLLLMVRAAEYFLDRQLSDKPMHASKFVTEIYWH